MHLHFITNEKKTILLDIIGEQNLKPFGFKKVDAWVKILHTKEEAYEEVKALWISGYEIKLADSSIFEDLKPFRGPEGSPEKEYLLYKKTIEFRLMSKRVGLALSLVSANGKKILVITGMTASHSFGDDGFKKDSIWAKMFKGTATENIDVLAPLISRLNAKSKIENLSDFEQELDLNYQPPEDKPSHIKIQDVDFREKGFKFGPTGDLQRVLPPYIFFDLEASTVQTKVEIKLALPNRKSCIYRYNFYPVMEKGSTLAESEGINLDNECTLAKKPSYKDLLLSTLNVSDPITTDIPIEVTVTDALTKRVYSKQKFVMKWAEVAAKRSKVKAFNEAPKKLVKVILPPVTTIHFEGRYSTVKGDIKFQIATPVEPPEGQIEIRMASTVLGLPVFVMPAKLLSYDSNEKIAHYIYENVSPQQTDLFEILALSRILDCWITGSDQHFKFSIPDTPQFETYRSEREQAKKRSEERARQQEQEWKDRQREQERQRSQYSSPRTNRIYHDLDPYAELGVSPSSKWDDIKKSYRQKAFEHHPDRGGSEDKMKQVNTAYEMLRQRHQPTAASSRSILASMAFRVKRDIKRNGRR